MSSLMTCRPGGRAVRVGMDQLFEEFFRSAQSGGESGAAQWSPAVDISEDQDNYLVKAEIPGMQIEQIDLEIEDNVLAIKGERKFEQAEQGEDYHFVERSYGSFYRRFTLPKNVDSAGIRAEYKAGVLEITIPKLEATKPQKVEITL